MDEKELAALNDEALLKVAAKRKKAAIINAALIGFMMGVVAYSFFKNSLGFFTLIPLFLAYKLFNNSKDYKALEKLLKERNLK